MMGQNKKYLLIKSKFFKGLADPARLSIVESLKISELNVKEITEKTGLTQSNVSNHLKCLLDCGLVKRSQKGKFNYYSLANQRLAEMLNLSEDLVNTFIQEIYTCVNYN